MRHPVYAFTALMLNLLIALDAGANPFHPDIELRNSTGERWHEGEAVSQWQTCVHCHDGAMLDTTLGSHHRQKIDNRTRLHHALGKTVALPKNIQKADCLMCHNPGAQRTLSELADANGTVTGKQLQLSSPGSDACGACHGLVSVAEPSPLSLPALEIDALFGLTGEVFSDQRVSRSALNIANKESLHQSFDIHAERVVGCSDCHSSPNNPSAPILSAADSHLRYDPRTLSAHDYLHKPDHRFEKARQCSDCHEVHNTHRWLPFFKHHLRKLSCESCHVPSLNAPAFASVDLAQQQVQWRGLQDNLILGFRPWLLPSAQGVLIPFNIIEVEDGKKTNFVAKAIHHSTQKQQATRECLSCHHRDSILFQTLPGQPDNIDLPSHFLNADNTPNLASSGIYVLGGNTVPGVDIAGLIILALTLLGISFHGSARYLASIKSAPSRVPRQRLYMYSRYERLWHWLQAATILLLLTTGAVIHKPWLFTWLSFRWMVEVHNILGFVLLINAALALFYHLASGQIKQYIPLPADMFVGMFEQVDFYLKGIFYNAPHPFEKSPEHKLNPLQKIAYFGLLNILLPLQMVSGLAMWGAQSWPQWANALGGLTVLGPAHSLLAWLFASFLIMHIYLTTTSGPKPLSGIRAMIKGWEDVEVAQETANHGK